MDNDCDGVVDEECLVEDNDGDGYSENVDCDDNDSTVYPGAYEIPYDGIDQDCNGSDLIDLDGDGHDSDEAGGYDCDDESPDTYPGATELCDGMDNNCDGLIDEDCADPVEEEGRAATGCGEPGEEGGSGCVYNNQNKGGPIEVLMILLLLLIVGRPLSPRLTSNFEVERDILQ